MAASQSVWGIDIGQCSLKALKLRQGDSSLEVEQFEMIEHGTMLSQPDVDAPSEIQATLREFLSRQSISDSTVCVSVLGQSSFTRFVKLPPVEEKRIPDIVRFEAEQQIPFPINEVTWRYQTFQDDDSPEVEAGIFAMKQVDIAQMLSYFHLAEMDVDVVQMAPLALYNTMMYDGLNAADGATMLADVGADKTHLVVADGSRLWTRTIPIGGNNFTQALVKSFKLSFEKAEKLKRTAAQSKYARQIFQVMRPIFADLVQEIQRSIGYYTSMNRESRFTQLVGMGNGFYLPGMQKYLEQNLNMPVKRAGSFHRLSCEHEAFNASAASFAVAYGLGLQGLDQATIHTNLLPESILRQRIWGKKKPWFAAAAASLVIAAGAYGVANVGDLNKLEEPASLQQKDEASVIAKRLSEYRAQSRKNQGDLSKDLAKIAENLSYRQYATVWPEIDSCISTAFQSCLLATSEQNIVKGFATATPEGKAKLAKKVRGDFAKLTLAGLLPATAPSEEGTPLTLREQLIAEVKSHKRNVRRLLLVEQQDSVYMRDLRQKLSDSGQIVAETPNAGSRYRAKETAPRGFRITIRLRTPLQVKLAATLSAELKKAIRYSLEGSQVVSLLGEVDSTTEKTRTAKPTGRRGARATIKTIAHPDPLFPDESIDKDTVFTLIFDVEVNPEAMSGKKSGK